MYLLLFVFIIFFSNAWRNLRLFFHYNNYKVMEILGKLKFKLLFQRDSDFFIRFLPTTNTDPQKIKLYEYGNHVEGFDVSENIL